MGDVPRRRGNAGIWVPPAVAGGGGGGGAARGVCGVAGSSGDSPEERRNAPDTRVTRERERWGREKRGSHGTHRGGGPRGRRVIVSARGAERFVRARALLGGVGTGRAIRHVDSGPGRTGGRKGDGLAFSGVSVGAWDWSCPRQ
jgi:hypothetical protein